MSRETAGRLAFIEAGGTPLDVGVALGRWGREAFHSRVVPSEAWSRLVEQGRRDQRLAAMRGFVEQHFARHLAEIEGLALGLGLPFDDVLAWNCRGDLSPTAPDGCTTVQMAGRPHVVGHNEDGMPGLAGHCALARIDCDGGRPFTSFVYPGSLPGHTFAVNAAGLVQTVNNIRPIAAGAGVPRMVLSRAILDLADIDAALALLRGHPRAGAFHLTLAKAGDRRLTSVEFTAGRVSALVVDAPAVHANHLVHGDTQGVSQIVTGSSGERQRRGNALIRQVAPGEDAALAILRDAADPRLPIWRGDPEDPDHENTLATAIFRVGADSVTWSVYDGREGPAAFSFDGTMEAAAA